MYIKIKADYNDADYIENTIELTENEFELIKPLINKIKKQTKKVPSWPGHGGSHNYDTTENSLITPTELYKDIDPDAFDLFDECIPRYEYGIHSIISIETFNIIDHKKLL